MPIRTSIITTQNFSGYSEAASRDENPDAGVLDLANEQGSDEVVLIDPYAALDLPAEITLRAGLVPVYVASTNNAQAQLLANGAPSNPVAVNLYQNTGRFAGSNLVNDEAFYAQERQRTIQELRLIYNNQFSWRPFGSNVVFSGSGASVNGYPLVLGSGNSVYSKPFAVQPSGGLATLTLYYSYNSGTAQYGAQTDSGFVSSPAHKLVSPLDSSYSGAPSSWQAIKLSSGVETLYSATLLNRQFYRAYGGDYVVGMTADQVRQKCFRISAVAYSTSGNANTEFDTMMGVVNASLWGSGSCRTRIGQPSDLTKYEDVLAAGSHLASGDFASPEQVISLASALQQGMAKIQLNLGLDSNGQPIFGQYQSVAWSHPGGDASLIDVTFVPIG